MNLEKEKFIHSKAFVIIMVVLLMSMVIFTGTYAWFTWSSTPEGDTSLTLTIGQFADVIFTSGNDITTGLTPVFNYYDGESTTFSINNRDTTGANVIYTVKLNITSITVPEELRGQVKYALVKNDTKVAEGDFSAVADETSIDIYTDILDSGITNYVFYLYLDGNVENADKNNEESSTIIDQTITGNIIVEAGDPETELLTTYLTNLYTGANPTLVTQENSLDTYYYASSVGMMNDGLDASGTWSDGVNAGNIRYYGSTPNNYIDIGERDTNGNIIPWRIIGVFKNITLDDGTEDTLVKVVRQTFFYDKWDSSSNNWHTSYLNDYLNNTYYSTLSDNVKNRIEKTEWNLGGVNSAAVFPDVLYGDERSDVKCSSCSYETIWGGKIALIYPSDYGYASNLTKCGYVLSQYNNDTINCIDTNWIFNIGTSAVGTNILHTLTPIVAHQAGIWNVNMTGELSTGAGNMAQSRLVLPTLYLNSDVEVLTDIGDGSSIDNAYILK